MEAEMLKLRQRMQQNASAYNKYLTKEYMDTLDFWELLANTHPDDRHVFKREYVKF